MCKRTWTREGKGHHTTSDHGGEVVSVTFRYLDDRTQTFGEPTDPRVWERPPRPVKPNPTVPSTGISFWWHALVWLVLMTTIMALVIGR